jgi:hypothetical protein
MAQYLLQFSASQGASEQLIGLVVEVFAEQHWEVQLVQQPPPPSPKGGRRLARAPGLPLLVSEGPQRQLCTPGHPQALRSHLKHVPTTSQQGKGAALPCTLFAGDHGPRQCPRAHPL